MTALILAGTAEARALCHAAHDLPVIASLAGVTRKPKDLKVKTRIGAFGGVAGFHSFLKAHQIRAVLDATHPFAGMVPRTYACCADAQIPYLRLTRPAWAPSEDLTWT